MIRRLSILPRSASSTLLLLVLLALAPPSRAQGGYDVQRHRTAGMDFPVPRRYAPVPVQPNERWVRFRFLENLEQAQQRTGQVRPELLIADLPYEPDPGPTTGEPPPPPPPEPEPEPRPEPRPEPGDDPPPDPGVGAGDQGEPAKPPPVKPAPVELPVTTFERFLERRLRGWEAKPSEDPVRPRRDWEGATYLLRNKASEKTGRVGWAHVWSQPRARQVVMLGFCHEADLADKVRTWRHMAGEIKLYEPKDDERERLERHYARRNLPETDYRIRVRLGLPKGWQSEDTPNYIVVYNTPDQPLVRQIVRDIELLRAEYVKLFPPARAFQAVSTVRVCADRDEYLAFSGLPSSAGYWNWMTEELVLYDATKKEKGAKTDKSDTFIVLYHEAFHQYIHYSSGELAPHSWFNEGYGDYFSGTQVTGGRVRGIGLNPWRIQTIQRAVEQNKHVSWREIIRYEQPAYYANAAICYAQGWSMIYFLNTSRHVQQDPRLSAILPLYFETLKSAWASELAQLEAEGAEEDLPKRFAAQVRARTAAVDKAFAGVDVDALERVWKTFVAGLGDGR